MSRRCRIKGVLLVSALLAFSAVSALAKDRLIIGQSQFPDNFNPNINAMAAKTYILSMARRPITVYDQDWNLVCMLCTELPSLAKGTARLEKTADGKPGIAVTYTLRKDARWGDGTPITTKDVLFTWEVGRHKLSGVSEADVFRRVARIDAANDKTFTLHLDKRACNFADITEFGLLPAHIERKNFSNPVEYQRRSAYETDTTNRGLWNGPYRVAQVVPGSHVVLTQNRFWWGKKPRFTEIIVKTISDTSAMTASLLARGIDYIAGEVGLTLDQAIAFEKRHGSRFRFVYKPALVYEHIDLNRKNPILADRRVRRALMYAIDREAISKQIFGGHQKVAHSNISPLDKVYDANAPKYAHDPDKARSLLAAAGWGTLRGGVRYNARNERLRLQIMTTAGNKTRELIQQILQSNWRDVGVEVQIRNEPARVFFGDTVRRRKFPSLAMYAFLAAPRAVPRTQLHSSEIPNAANNWAGSNFPGFNNPEMDRAIEGAETDCAPDRNQAHWNRLQALYAEELPALPLYFRAEPHIMPTWLKGVRPTGHQYASTLWIEDWYDSR